MEPIKTDNRTKAYGFALFEKIPKLSSIFITFYDPSLIRSEFSPESSIHCYRLHIRQSIVSALLQPIQLPTQSNYPNFLFTVLFIHFYAIYIFNVQLNGQAQTSDNNYSVKNVSIFFRRGYLFLFAKFNLMPFEQHYSDRSSVSAQKTAAIAFGQKCDREKHKTKKKPMRMINAMYSDVQLHKHQSNLFHWK